MRIGRARHPEKTNPAVRGRGDQAEDRYLRDSAEGLVEGLRARPAALQDTRECKEQHHDDRESQNCEVEAPEDEINALVRKKLRSTGDRPSARRCLYDKLKRGNHWRLHHICRYFGPLPPSLGVQRGPS